MGEERQPLWTGRELEKATRGRWLKNRPPPPDFDPFRVSYDIRGLKPGNLVVCTSPRTWGSKRADTSLELARVAAKGAAGAIIQRDQVAKLPNLPPKFPVLVVENTFAALADLCKASRARFAGRVVAITGTVGKTTSREMLVHVGGKQGGAVGNRANNNNIAGVARTMAYTRRELAWSAIEMGFGYPLDGISTCSRLVRPHVALIASVSAAHLDMFTAQQLQRTPGERLVLQHKMRIVDGLERGGTAVFNRDMPFFEEAAAYAEQKGARVMSFGVHPEATSRLDDVELGPKGSRVSATIDGEKLEYSLQVPGMHMAINSIGVLTCIVAGGGDLKRASGDISEFEPIEGRSRVIEVPFEDGQVQLIDDSFNATPASVASSLALLELAEPAPGGRRVAVLGEIGHLGPNEAEIHADLAVLVERYRVDRLFTWGSLMKHLRDRVPEARRGHHCDTVSELYLAVREFLRPGDALTVKSGRGQGGLGDSRFRAFIRAFKRNAPRLPDEHSR
jgi:UDP-N-acetylmuramoyl-tripeptide--D-alanyl-D-alanine ligase